MQELLLGEFLLEVTAQASREHLLVFGHLREFLLAMATTTHAGVAARESRSNGTSLTGASPRIRASAGVPPRHGGS